MWCHGVLLKALLHGVHKMELHAAPALLYAHKLNRYMKCARLHLNVASTRRPNALLEGQLL